MPVQAPVLEYAPTGGGERLLKRTVSRCPVCRVACPGEVWLRSGVPEKVFLLRRCAEHGEASACIASDARFYWLAQGKWENASRAKYNGETATSAPSNVCLAASGCRTGTLGSNAFMRDDGEFEKLSTCLALIEIVDSCNLSCPTCYADSPVGIDHKVAAVPMAELKARIDAVIRRKGKLEILQLSGGEPTLHPQFFELLEWAQDHPHIDYLLINTNGVRLATDDDFRSKLALAARRRSIQLYLQFDGVQEDGQRSLRGADLRQLRQKAIERCGQIGLPVTLAMTVTPGTLAWLWQAIAFGLQHTHIRGICFQPLFGSGRVASAHQEPRLNTADILLAAVEQSNGSLRFEDFTPLPCGDPNCATIGYLLKANGRTYSVSDFIDFTKVQDFLKDKIRYNLEDLLRCGCENEPLGELLKRFEMDESNTFRILVKPFMDAWTWDEDRIDRCCTHVIRPDSKLDSFCRYYSGFSDLSNGT